MYMYILLIQRDLCDMIHWMGGSVRNKVSIAVTHVVAHNVSGAKYKVLDIYMYTCTRGCYNILYNFEQCPE